MHSSNGKSAKNDILDKCFVCNKLSSLKCSNCVKVLYCSVEHQRQDWKRHKSTCHPFEIESDEKFGRYLIASRDIKPGDIILKESPLIRGPSQITNPVCIRCLQGLLECDINPELQCDRCGWPICAECKNRSNPQAKQHDECDITVARGNKFSLQHYFNPHPTYQCITVLRCLLLKEHAPHKWQKLIQLESHCDERRGSLQWCNDREGVAKFIPRFFKCNGKWDEDEILKVAGIVQINGHEVPLTDPPHVAIYDLASLVEHSCAPNVTKSFTIKGDLVFWSPNAIRRGEHLSICYSDALWGTEDRRNHLLQTKMFKCECRRCMDATEFGTFYSAIKCNRVGGCDGLLLPENVQKSFERWRCNLCANIVDQTYVRSILNRAAKDLENMEKGNEEQCFKFLEHYSKWLPPNHYYLCDVELTLTQAIGGGDQINLQTITDEKLQKKIDLCQKLLRLFSILAAAESRCLGALHFELHAALAELGRRAIQNKNDCFRSAIEDSLKNAEQVVRLLQHEPLVLSEGQICAQAKVNIESLKMILSSPSSSTSSSTSSSLASVA